MMLGRFTSIIGKMGTGKTLAAIALLKNLRDSKIVSNVKLYEIPYEPFHSENLFDYKDNIIFLDMVDLFMGQKDKFGEQIHYNFLGFINQLEEGNNRLIVTCQDLEYLSPDIRIFYCDVIIRTTYSKEKNHVCLLVYDGRITQGEKALKVYIKDIDQYFKYYETRSILKL